LAGQYCRCPCVLLLSAIAIVFAIVVLDRALNQVQSPEIAFPVHIIVVTIVSMEWVFVLPARQR